jgi:hypothetical protein
MKRALFLLLAVAFIGTAAAPAIVTVGSSYGDLIYEQPYVDPE